KIACRCGCNSSCTSRFGTPPRAGSDTWLDRKTLSARLSNIMPAPLISDVISDLLEEIFFLLQGTGAEPLERQLRALRIESICDCGDGNCSSFATAAEVKVDTVVELNPSEGFLIIDLNQSQRVCFIEVLGR